MRLLVSTQQPPRARSVRWPLIPSPAPLGAAGAAVGTAPRLEREPARRHMRNHSKKSVFFLDTL